MLDFDGLTKIMELSINDSFKAMADRDIYAECQASPSAFENWIGAVQSEPGVLSPKNIVVPCPKSFTEEVLERLQLSSESINFVRAVCTAVETMAEETGYPVFVKNSHTSNKHDFKDSCSFPNADFDDVLARLVSMARYLSIGPTLYAGNVIVREMIPTTPVFEAFNGLPITREFRLFAESGSIKGYQPYWGQEAFIRDEPVDPDWSAKLDSLKAIRSSQLRVLVRQAEGISRKLGGYWSIDFLQGKDGRWWLIDMAEGHLSYVNEADYKSLVRDPKPEQGLTI